MNIPKGNRPFVNDPSKSGWYVAYCGVTGDYFKAYFNKEVVDERYHPNGTWQLHNQGIAFGTECREKDLWYELNDAPPDAQLMVEQVKSNGTPFVHMAVDKSGMRELWLVKKDEKGLIIPLAGPEKLPTSFEVFL